jgi:phenylalanine-4-hydroxylase
MAAAASARLELGALKQLGRLYWYTVEFGLIAGGRGPAHLWRGHRVELGREPFRARRSEPQPHRLRSPRVMRTEYRIDDFQQNYFVIPSFDELLRVTIETDFAPLYEEILPLPDIPVAEILPEDDVITRGTQEYARAKG